MTLTTDHAVRLRDALRRFQDADDKLAGPDADDLDTPDVQNAALVPLTREYLEAYQALQAEIEDCDEARA